MKINKLEVKLHGQIVAYLGENEKGNVVFEYDDTFKVRHIEISPLKLPTDTTTLYQNSDDSFFQGLPGVIYDSLPDKFGNKIIDAYYAKKGITSLSPLQRLAYVGPNGMGALEYYPNEVENKEIKEVLDVQALVNDAKKVFQGETTDIIPDLMEAGGSAGGARAKAIIAWDGKNSIHSPRRALKKGHEHYLIKFDGTGIDMRPADYCKVEYMYMKIANLLHLPIPDMHLFHEREYSHLILKRFDRIKDKKIHMHSLCGMAHSNFNIPGFSYEEYFKIILHVTKNIDNVFMAYTHMLLNVIGRNQDDHTKNFSFLMDETGEWDLAPVYDFTYSNGDGITARHQMSINGKRDDFTLKDLLEIGDKFLNLPPNGIKQVIGHVQNVFMENTLKMGKELSIDVKKIEKIRNNARVFNINT
jgi:serine/threonine-protein kinase HipA